jgi:hypothetical protein
MHVLKIIFRSALADTFQSKENQSIYDIIAMFDQ